MRISINESSLFALKKDKDMNVSLQISVLGVLDHFYWQYYFFMLLSWTNQHNCSESSSASLSFSLNDQRTICLFLLDVYKTWLSTVLSRQSMLVTLAVIVLMTQNMTRQPSKCGRNKIYTQTFEPKSLSMEKKRNSEKQSRS